LGQDFPKKVASNKAAFFFFGKVLEKSLGTKFWEKVLEKSLGKKSWPIVGGSKSKDLANEGTTPFLC
jgi:hypothetical protein